MDHPVERLQCTWVKQPREEWLGDLEKLAEGYPFEKRRHSLQRVNRRRQFHRSLKKSGRTTHFLAAHFDERLVGWLRVRHHSLHSKHAPVPVHRADWELVQRNRDDIRGSMIDAVREKFSGAVVQFHQPAQNRTARRFFGTQPDVLTGEQELFLAHEDPPSLGESSAPPPGMQWGNLTSVPRREVETLLGKYRRSRLHQGPLFRDETARQILVDWLLDSIDEAYFRAEGLIAEGRLAGVVATRRNPKSFPTDVRVGSLSYIQVHPDYHGRSLGRLLLSRGFAHLLNHGVEYVETKLCGANETALEFYRRHGMNPVTKRRHLHLVTDPELDLPL